MAVILVYTDCSRQTVPEAEAWRQCGDPTTAGRIIDALTEDALLQRNLRQRMDNLSD